jgi:hypothetical protein
MPARSGRRCASDSGSNEASLYSDPACLSTVRRRTRAARSISVTNAPKATIVKTMAPPKDRNRSLAAVSPRTPPRNSTSTATQVNPPDSADITTATSSIRERRRNAVSNSSRTGSLASCERVLTRSAIRASRVANTLSSVAVADNRKTGVNASCTRCAAASSVNSVIGQARKFSESISRIR